MTGRGSAAVSPSPGGGEPGCLQKGMWSGADRQQQPLSARATLHTPVTPPPPVPYCAHAGGHWIASCRQEGKTLNFANKFLISHNGCVCDFFSCQMFVFNRDFLIGHISQMQIIKGMWHFRYSYVPIRNKNIARCFFQNFK